LKLEQQIIVAGIKQWSLVNFFMMDPVSKIIVFTDCQVLIAILNFLQQDWSSYMKGAWVLRKAWKIYQKTYVQIRHLYIKRIGLRGNSIGKGFAIFILIE